MIYQYYVQHWQCLPVKVDSLMVHSEPVFIAISLLAQCWRHGVSLLLLTLVVKEPIEKYSSYHANKV